MASTASFPFLRKAKPLSEPPVDFSLHLMDQKWITWSPLGAGQARHTGTGLSDFVPGAVSTAGGCVTTGEEGTPW